MLNEWIEAIRTSKTEKERNQYYKALARLGMDKYTVDTIIEELIIEELANKEV